MEQSKLESLVEVCLNVGMGFVVSYSVGPIWFAYLGLDYDPISNLVVTLGFTVLAIGRGYAVRRWFNNRLHTVAIKIARRLKCIRA